MRPPPTPTLFPYTTLFRSEVMPHEGGQPLVHPRNRVRVVPRNLPGPRAHLGAALPSSDVQQHHVARSEEHTSELQSPCNLVCRLLLEKKKKHPRDASLPYH